MSNQGWIKLHREIMDWEWYLEPNTFRLFIHLLLRANRAPGKYKGIDLLTGQVITGRKQLSKELKLTEREIRTSINRLKSTNSLTIKTTNKFSIITICKYDDYQVSENKYRPAERPADGPTSDQQATTNKNKENKENKREGKLGRFSPPTLPQIEEYFKLKISEKGLKYNPRDEAIKFDSNYGSKNWFVGKNKMTDWKKAVSGWIARIEDFKQNTPTLPQKGKGFSAKDLEKQYQ